LAPLAWQLGQAARWTKLPGGLTWQAVSRRILARGKWCATELVCLLPPIGLFVGCVPGTCVLCVCANRSQGPSCGTPRHASSSPWSRGRPLCRALHEEGDARDGTSSLGRTASLPQVVREGGGGGGRGRGRGSLGGQEQGQVQGRRGADAAAGSYPVHVFSGGGGGVATRAQRRIHLDAVPLGPATSAGGGAGEEAAAAAAAGRGGADSASGPTPGAGPGDARRSEGASGQKAGGASQ